jgi:hypothetical protein
MEAAQTERAARFFHLRRTLPRSKAQFPFRIPEQTGRRLPALVRNYLAGSA